MLQEMPVMSSGGGGGIQGYVLSADSSYNYYCTKPDYTVEKWAYNASYAGFSDDNITLTQTSIGGNNITVTFNKDCTAYVNGTSTSYTAGQSVMLNVASNFNVVVVD